MGSTERRREARVPPPSAGPPELAASIAGPRSALPKSERSQW